MSLIPWQVQAEAWLQSFTAVAAFMRQTWSWPIVESIHFVGLTLLLGSIAAWDLRLLGWLRHVPIVAFHALIPFAIVGFVINAVSGLLFLVTYPDQYVYNSAFQLKMLCVGLAGSNVAVFYMTSFARIATLGSGSQAPARGRLAGTLSLALWITVIICGRMITFFRPPVCAASEAARFIADCIVR